MLDKLALPHNQNYPKGGISCSKDGCVVKLPRYTNLKLAYIRPLNFYTIQSVNLKSAA